MFLTPPSQKFDVALTQLNWESADNVGEMQTPLLAFQFNPAAAVFAVFGSGPVNSMEAAFSATLLSALEQEQEKVTATLSPLQEGMEMERKKALDHFARLAETQAVDRKAYAIAVDKATYRIPGANFFKSRDVLMDEVRGKHSERITVENWNAHLLADEDAGYFLHFPMFRDIRSVIMDVAEVVLNAIGKNGSMGVHFNLLLYDDPETGIPRFRAKGSEDPEGGRGAAIVLELEVERGIPRNVAIGCRFSLSTADQNNAPFLQELQTMTHRVFWMLDNYKARIKSQQFLQIGESIWITGREIRMSSDGENK